MMPEETGSQPDNSRPPETISHSPDLHSPSPDAFAVTHTGGEVPDPNLTRSQVTPTPTAPHLPQRGDENWSPPGYTITGELGRGGMGVVYGAIHNQLKREVAIKMMLASNRDDRNLIRFLIEAESMAQVRHTNVVQVFEAGEQNGYPFLTLEYLPGGTLAERLAKGRLPIRDALKLMLKIAKGVEAAHRQGIVHRDLKPGNVMFDATGEPKVGDFGLAKHGKNDLTATDAMMGTPSYMAPEQAKGETKTAGPAADVFSLGIMLYEMITGKRPFTGEQTAAVVYKIIHDAPEAPRRREPSIPRDVEVITLKCLAKDPRDRYTDAGQLVEDLERFLADKPIEARSASSWERSVKWSRRNPVVASLLMMVLLLTVIGAIFGSWQYGRILDERNQAELARREVSQKAEEISQKAAEISQKADDLGVAVKEKTKAEQEATKKANDLAVALDYAKHQTGVGNFLLAKTAFEKNDLRMTRDRLDLIRPEQRGWEWHYLRRQSEGGIFTLYGHTSGIWSVSFSPDGKRIVTGSEDNTAKVWNARTGTRILDLKGHLQTIWSVSFSPDGTRIVTGSSDKTAKVWDALTGKQVLDLKGHVKEVLSVAYSPDGTEIVTSSGDTTAKVWDARTGKLKLDLIGHTQLVWSVSFSPDGSRIITGSQDATAIVWDARTGKRVTDLKGQNQIVTSVSFSPDGSRIVIGDGNENPKVKVLDARTGVELLHLNGHTGWVNSVMYSPDGTRIVTGSHDEMVKVWDARTGTPLFELKGHTGWVNSVKYSPDGTQIISSSKDGTAKIWDAQTSSPAVELTGLAGKIERISHSPDGSRIFAESFHERDNFLSANVWDARTGTQLFDFSGSSSANDRVFFSPEGSWIFKQRDDERPQVWDARTGKLSHVLEGCTAVLFGVTFSPDGKKIVAQSHDKRPQVWDVRTGKLLHVLQGQTASIFNFYFSPDGTRIVAITEDKTAKLWDAGTGKLVHVLQGHTAKLFSVTYSPDGTRIVTGSEDKTAKLWDAQTGTLVVDLHSDFVGNVSFSEDGSRIFTLSNNMAKIWDARSGALVVELKGHNQSSKVSFSEDGSRIITLSHNMAKVWDARTGALMIDLKGESVDVSSVSFSPEGNRIVTLCSKGTAKIWDARTATPLFELKDQNANITNVSYSPDGNRIITGNRYGDLLVWDTRATMPVIDLKGHTAIISQMSYNSDATRIVTASQDGSAKVWDTRTGTLLVDLKGETVTVSSVCYSPDDTRIVTGSQDGTVKVWDSRTGMLLYKLPAHMYGVAVSSVCFNPDGTRIVTGGKDGTVKIWDFHAGTMVLALKPNADKRDLFRVWQNLDGTPLAHNKEVSEVSYSLDGTRIVTRSKNEATVKVWDSKTGKEILGEPIPKTKDSQLINPDRLFFSQIVYDSVVLIPLTFDSREYEYRLFHTQPPLRLYERTVHGSYLHKTSFAKEFYSDRILSTPNQRKTYYFKDRIEQLNNPLTSSRTSFHQQAFAKTPYDRNSVAALALAGDRLAQRLVAQERIREGKPALAVPLLTSCMITRPRNAPPVEELLIAKAYLALNDRPQAERYYRAATEWLDRPRNPIRAAEVITKSAINGWAALGEAFKPIDDPRHNPFDWESWHESDVFRAEVETGLTKK